jgi:uncharacterized damage-inducible protein DinB
MTFRRQPGKKKKNPKPNYMLKQILANEIRHEGSQTKRLLERIPVDNFDWKPHEKSREIGKLALHVAEIPKWTSRIITTPEVDIITLDRQFPEVHSAQDLVNFSEANIQQAVEDLQNANEDDLMKMWTLRRGEQVVFTMPRAAVIRAMAMNHLLHHRGQLTVYLRLLNIPVPGMYGPSADEM